MHSRGYIYTRIKAQVIDKDIHVHGDYRGDYIQGNYRTMISE